MVLWSPAGSRTRLDHEGFEGRPLLIRHRASNKGCSPHRAALEPKASEANQRSGDLGIHIVNTT